MSPFTKILPTDKAELKAVLFALLVCCLFIGFVSVVNQGSRRIKKRGYAELMIPPPMAPTKLLEPEAPPLRDFNERYRRVSKNFKNVDFKNRSYGVYAFPDGKTSDLRLEGGGLLLPNGADSFMLRDVYYTDLTGDKRPEAIVRLSHVAGGGNSWDTSDIFYIYTRCNGKLITLWQYETGSRTSGCSLKSLTVSNQIVLELFGNCPKQESDRPRPAKFGMQDLTFLLFSFDGQRFQQQVREVVSTPATKVKSYEPAIHIFEYASTIEQRSPKPYCVYRR